MTYTYDEIIHLFGVWEYHKDADYEWLETNNGDIYRNWGEDEWERE